MKFMPGDLVAWDCECDITGEVTVELGVVQSLSGLNPSYPVVRVLTPEGVIFFTKKNVKLVSRYKVAK